MESIDQNRNPAEIYDEFFVPALFAQWGNVVCDAAELAPGQRVLDVACGTGALTLAAADRVGATGSVTGLDANPQMLAVARRKPVPIEWIEGRAESLPMPDRSFDAVVSQFGFMFFDDRPGAMREMMRVLRTGGKLAVAVCDDIEHSPGYSAFAKLLDSLFGTRVGGAFRAPFVLGDREVLMAVCEEAGIDGAKVSRRNGSVRFRSIADLVSTERACAWTLGGLLDEEQFEQLLRGAQTWLQPFVKSDGSIEFDMPALIVVAERQVTP